MGLTRQEWEETHQHFESDWWGDCANTYGEETKQIAYAKVMGMDPGPWKGGDKWPTWDMGGRRILDVGGGPASMLLKCTGLVQGVVVDPCDYPAWTLARYDHHGIEVIKAPAEDALPDFRDTSFDGAWMYNVLQHVHDPRAIIEQMFRVAAVVRIFEWVETEPYLGHPHTLHVEDLQEWCGGPGRTVVLDEVYRETRARRNPVGRVEQKAWGGVFGRW
jgi:SAM-dependent methyltransferase